MSAVPQPELVRVVLVDDTTDLRELLRFALEQHEFRVVGEAGDGRTGLEVVRETQPDLVLLDLAMPVMDGFEALPLVRGACPDAVVLVLSGFDAATTGARACDLGAHGYLEKGSSLRATIAQVREAVTQAQVPTPHLSVVHGAVPDGATTPAGLSPDLSLAPSARAGSVGVSPARLAAVPFGVVEVDADTLTVRHANPAAERLLGAVPVGSGLHEPLPELTLVEGTQQVSRDGRPLGVTLTRTPDALVLVVAPSTEA